MVLLPGTMLELREERLHDGSIKVVEPLLARVVEEAHLLVVRFRRRFGDPEELDSLWPVALPEFGNDVVHAAQRKAESPHARGSRLRTGKAIVPRGRRRSTGTTCRSAASGAPRAAAVAAAAPGKRSASAPPSMPRCSSRGFSRGRRRLRPAEPEPRLTSLYDATIEHSFGRGNATEGRCRFAPRTSRQRKGIAASAWRCVNALTCSRSSLRPQSQQVAVGIG